MNQIISTLLKRKRFNMRPLVFTSLSVVFVLSGTSVPMQSSAEAVRLPVGTSNSYQGSLPQRGQAKSQVEAEFGIPDSTHGPSGQPPIYYWEYPDFTVYFESDYVIHAVVKKR